ncbi:MAG: hypothetical protein NTW06_02115 [Candidatus Falkowbacteria bacterium]|nr:hypothetical protein [Candidatus Falkowbacteria bacterium]
MINSEYCQLIRKLKWEEVFLYWYINEGTSESWIKLARDRGFASWAEWRLKGYADRFQCQKTDWGLYEVSNPAKVVAEFYGGPFRTWIARHYGGDKTRSFAELATRESIVKNPAVRSMVNDFPVEKIITCLELKNGKIYTIEGMHRCCSLALIHKENKPGPASLRFAIGKSRLKELPPVGQAG